eukprot:364263-Chlamydomonas_euryale.AAC.5
MDAATVDTAASWRSIPVDGAYAANFAVDGRGNRRNCKSSCKKSEGVVSQHAAGTRRLHPRLPSADSQLVPLFPRAGDEGSSQEDTTCLLCRRSHVSRHSLSVATSLRIYSLAPLNDAGGALKDRPAKKEIRLRGGFTKSPGVSSVPNKESPRAVVKKADLGCSQSRPVPLRKPNPTLIANSHKPDPHPDERASEAPCVTNEVRLIHNAHHFRGYAKKTRCTQLPVVR